MKRFFCLFLLLALLLAGCGANGSKVPTEHMLDIDGTTMTATVDPAAQTLTVGSDVYRYETDGNTLQIIYPNGAVYSETENGIISWEGNYDWNRYLSGFVLSNVLHDAVIPSSVNAAALTSGLFALAFGLWGLLAPGGMWYLFYGWRYKNAEPSDIALVMNRVSGTVLILLGIVLLLNL